MQEKRCARCVKVKPAPEFGADHTRHDGLNKYCRPCQRSIRRGSYYKDVERSRQLARSAAAGSRLKTMFGLTVEERNAMAERQGNVCPICGRGGRLVLDHDHSSGEVRGLLCYRCNIALALIDEGLLDNALAYLGASTNAIQLEHA